MKALEIMELSFNQHTGTLPETWGGLKALDSLKLVNNARLTGTIPCSWASIGSKAKGNFEGKTGTPGTLLHFAVGGTGLIGCFPSAGLQAASDKFIAAEGYPTPVKGVRGEWQGTWGCGCIQAEQGQQLHCDKPTLLLWQPWQQGLQRSRWSLAEQPYREFWRIHALHLCLGPPGNPK
jgi:hypothetical protein